MLKNNKDLFFKKISVNYHNNLLQYFPKNNP